MEKKQQKISDGICPLPSSAICSKFQVIYVLGFNS